MAPCFGAIFLSALAVLEAIASPVEHSYSNLQKRVDQAPATSPVVSPEFKGKQLRQIMDGILDARLLAHYAILPLLQHKTTIFEKYFLPEDETIVKEIFQNILGGAPRGRRDPPTTQPHNPGLLSDITIAKDFPRGDFAGTMACDDRNVRFELRDANTPHPKLIACDRSFTELGGLAQGYRNGPRAVTCNTIGDRVSFRMDFFGSYLLEMYLSWDRMVRPPLDQEPLNLAYGPFRTRRLVQPLSPSYNPRRAKLNPDSYMWYALESTWQQMCCKNFGDPSPIGDFGPPQ